MKSPVYTVLLYKIKIAASQIADPVIHLLSVNTVRLFTSALLLSVTATSSAADNDSSGPATAYVDSIHQWGAWALDIEPAAGGLQRQTTQPLNARGTKLTLRTNSISALAPAPPANTNQPAIPVAPTPTPPPVTPPIGGPADGLF